MITTLRQLLAAVLSLSITIPAFSAPVGNRTRKVSTLPGYPGGLTNYNANDQLSTDTYDANGNTTQSQGNGYVYDFENHLISANGITYTYDGDGHRVFTTNSAPASRAQPYSIHNLSDGIPGTTALRAASLGVIGPKRHVDASFNQMRIIVSALTAST